jgi:hypothetical protein
MEPSKIEIVDGVKRDQRLEKHMIDMNLANDNQNMGSQETWATQSSRSKIAG